MRNRRLLTSCTVAWLTVFWNSELVEISGIEFPDAVTLNAFDSREENNRGKLFAPVLWL